MHSLQGALAAVCGGQGGSSSSDTLKFLHSADKALEELDALCGYSYCTEAGQRNDAPVAEFGLRPGCSIRIFPERSDEADGDASASSGNTALRMQLPPISTVPNSLETMAQQMIAASMFIDATQTAARIHQWVGRMANAHGLDGARGWSGVGGSENASVGLRSTAVSMPRGVARPPTAVTASLRKAQLSGLAISKRVIKAAGERASFCRKTLIPALQQSETFRIIGQACRPMESGERSETDAVAQIGGAIALSTDVLADLDSVLIECQVLARAVQHLPEEWNTPGIASTTSMSLAEICAMQVLASALQWAGACKKCASHGSRCTKRMHSEVHSLRKRSAAAMEATKSMLGSDQASDPSSS